MENGKFIFDVIFIIKILPAIKIFTFQIQYPIPTSLQYKFRETYHDISGGSSLYITGVTSRASSVEVINPPIITQARGE